MRTMSGGPCLHYDCSNRNSFGYCKTTVCINEHYRHEEWASTSNRTERETVKPAADVRPNVTGTWVGIDGCPHEEWECDKCGCIVSNSYDPWNYWHFCPNCGAKMTIVKITLKLEEKRR